MLLVLYLAHYNQVEFLMKEKLRHWATWFHDQFFQKDYWKLKDEEEP